MTNLHPFEIPVTDEQLPESPDNEQRAGYAEQALTAYTVAKGNDPDDSNLQDLITDCLHLMLRRGCPPGDILISLNSAINNFEAESDVELGCVIECN